MPTARRLMIKPASPCDCEKKETNVGWWTVPGAICHGAWAAKGAVDFPTSFIDLSGSPKSSVVTFPPTDRHYSIDGRIVGHPTWNAVDGWVFVGNKGLFTSAMYCMHDTVIFRFSHARRNSSLFGVSTFGTDIATGKSTRVDIIPDNYGKVSGYHGGPIRVRPGFPEGIIGFAGDRMIVNKLVVPEIFRRNKKAGYICMGDIWVSAYVYIQAFAVYCGKLTKAETDALGDRMLAI